MKFRNLSNSKMNTFLSTDLYRAVSDITLEFGVELLSAWTLQHSSTTSVHQSSVVFVFLATCDKHMHLGYSKHVLQIRGSIDEDLMYSGRQKMKPLQSRRLSDDVFFLDSPKISPILMDPSTFEGTASQKSWPNYLERLDP